MDMRHYHAVIVLLIGLLAFVSGDFCIYKSRIYYQGEKWEDGCHRTCMCVDASTRRYTCKDMCPEYTDIPHGCRLKEVDGQCYPELVCDRDVTPNCNTGGPTVGPCDDKLPNCAEYGRNQDICKPPYENWAKDNCNGYCGFCMGMGTGTGGGGSLDACRDANPNCNNYGASVCTEYREWARDNCVRFCGFCRTMIGTGTGTMTGTGTGTMTGTGTGTMTGGTGTGSGSLTGGGTGTGGGGCRDQISNCAAYGGEVCENLDYTSWVLENCQQYCGHCSGTSMLGSSSGCVYKGHIYHQGDGWDDECYDCTCEDEMTGFYKCQARDGTK